MSEHDIIRGIPSTAKTLLRFTSLNSMKRTSSNNNIFFYRGKVHESMRVIVNLDAQSISFIRELPISSGIRKEDLIYNYSNNTLTKTFNERSFYGSIPIVEKYPFVIDECSYFLQSTVVLNKFFPSLEDFVIMHSMKDDFLSDVQQWVMGRDKKKRAK